jgi:hypothetical protein
MFQDANDEMIEDRRRRDRKKQRRRSLPFEQIRNLRKLIDDLLRQLEDVNTLNIDRVPANLREQADRLLKEVSGEGDDRLRVSYRVIPLMDRLYQAQEILSAMLNPGIKFDD